MLKIWGRASAVNVQKVLWCVGELDLHYERIDAGMQFGVNMTAEFKAMNPNGLVPVIDDDGFILWESQPIVRHLARKHGLGSLCPADPRACADSDRWMDWCATTAWPHLRPVLLSLTRVAPADRDTVMIRESRDRLAERVALLDAHLRGREYVTGDKFTMGDIPLGALVQRWFNLPIEREPFANVFTYYETLRKRPAFRQYVDLPLV